MLRHQRRQFAFPEMRKLLARGLFSLVATHRTSGVSYLVMGRLARLAQPARGRQPYDVPEGGMARRLFRPPDQRDDARQVIRKRGADVHKSSDRSTRIALLVLAAAAVAHGDLAAAVAAIVSWHAVRTHEGLK